MPSLKLTKRAIDGIRPGEKDYYVFDTELLGFGIRVRVSGKLSYFVRYRPKPGGRSAPVRRYTIARVGEITPEQAREEAWKVLAEVKAGRDPAARRAAERSEMTISELADAFLKDHVNPKRRATTGANYQGSIENYIKPALGTKRIDKLTAAEIARLHLQTRDKPATANRILAVLSSMFGFADRRGLVPEGFNPARRIERFAETGRERFLSVDELETLGVALRTAETEGAPWDIDGTSPNAKHIPKGERRTIIGPHAAGAIRLLLFTGCRLREILHLRWENVDFERGLLHLPTSKTGKLAVILNAPALAVLESLPRVGSYVIFGETPDKPRSDLKRPWAAVTALAGLSGLRIHDLRHSFASVGAGSGMGLPIVGRLLGHTKPATTARYAHFDNDPLRTASERIGGKIAAALEGKPRAAVLPLKRAPGER